MKPKQFIRTKEELVAIMGTPSETQANKCIDHIDELCRAWIERTPFIVISTAGSAGAMDISPKGDPAGFVKVLDENTLAIPDRRGNRRADSLANLLENPNCAIVFIIPRRREVVRVNGVARIACDPHLLQSMAIDGKAPDLAIIVQVKEAMFHCGKSVVRSGLWEPDAWPSIDGLPSYAQALQKHAKPTATEEEMEAHIATGYKERLY